MVKYIKLFVSLIVPFVAGGIGSLATYPNIATWYAALEKPFFSPPNWVFGPVWTLLYILMGVSLYLVWTSRLKRSKEWAYGAFGVQIILNTAWSLVFFGLHAPAAAVFVIILLLGAILATAKLFWPFSRTAAYLLIPYILWVCFATALNIAVAILN